MHQSAPENVVHVKLK